MVALDASWLLCFLFVSLLCSCFNIPVVAADYCLEVVFSFMEILPGHDIKEARIFFFAHVIVLQAPDVKVQASGA